MFGSTRCWWASPKGGTTYPPSRSTTESSRAGAVVRKTPSATYIVLGTNFDPSNHEPPRYSTPCCGAAASCGADAAARSHSASTAFPGLRMASSSGQGCGGLPRIGKSRPPLSRREDPLERHRRPARVSSVKFGRIVMLGFEEHDFAPEDWGALRGLADEL